jgi:hypothetical protein
LPNYKSGNKSSTTPHLDLPPHRTPSESIGNNLHLYAPLSNIVSTMQTVWQFPTHIPTATQIHPAFLKNHRNQHTPQNSAATADRGQQQQPDGINGSSLAPIAAPWQRPHSWQQCWLHGSNSRSPASTPAAVQKHQQLDCSNSCARRNLVGRFGETPCATHPTEGTILGDI